MSIVRVVSRVLFCIATYHTVLITHYIGRTVLLYLNSFFPAVSEVNFIQGATLFQQWLLISVG